MSTSGRPGRLQNGRGRLLGRWRGPVLLLLLALAVTQVAVAQTALADDSARSILVHFTNRSDSTLTLASKTLDGGCWSEGLEPPAKIAIDQSVDIASESCGFLTGTEFHVSYTLDLSGATMKMHYSNPFVGEDTFEETAPQGYAFESFDVIENRTTRFGCNSATCDGIPDDWKKNGVTIDPGGGNPPQFVDLPKMGVSLDRPNVLVQLDWMKDDTHNQLLRQSAIDTVIKAFDQEGVTHRGATRSGITLLVDAGKDSTLTPGGAKWGPLSRAKEIPWTQALLTGSRSAGYQEKAFYDLLKSNFVPTGRLPIFHYSVAAAEIAMGDSTSGLTTEDKLGFMVTLFDWTGGVGSENEQTGTFMHEFGHALGLTHGGQDGNDDKFNYKPNYPSVMNYVFQTKGVPRGGAQVFDYSRDNTPDVDETKLTEAGGVNLGANPSGYGTGHACAGKDASGNPVVNKFVQNALSPVDWSCDTTTPNGGTGFDANADGAQQTLNGSTSDWSRLQFKTGGVGAGAGAKDTVTIPSSGVSAPNQEQTVEMARLTRVLPLDTKLTYTGSTSGDYHDAATVSATLVDPGNGNSPVAGRTITFRIGSSSTDTCSATTDASGTASCAVTPTQASGSYPVTASFAGDTIYKPASDSDQTFEITTEETTITYTGQTAILQGASGATLKARLVEDGASDDDGDGGARAPYPAGRSVKLSLGSQSCTGLTDESGIATCTLTFTGALGPQPLKAEFLGDAYYRPSSDTSKTAIVFAFPSRGAFVLGDSTVASASPTTTVSWWNDAWWTVNTLTGGVAPLSFKGFAATVTALPTTSPADVCGSTFKTLPGNSPPPTGDIPAYMGVLVANSVTKAGNGVTGKWGQIVVVKTNPGYAPSPGHPGTGTIVATFCP
jgi:Bacterial Ig-like domain (group 3)/Peptidase M66